MAPPPNGPRALLAAVNLVTLVAAVAVMWWRVGRLEAQVQALEDAVHAVQLEVAVLHQTLNHP